MPFQEVAAHRLYQQVAEQIAGLIRGGELAPGERLPAERDLARRLHISRPVLREALVALEIAGLVEVRTGSGAYVAQPRASTAALADAGPSTFAIIAARRVVEGEVAALAAELGADTASIAALRGLVAEQRQAVAAGQTGHAEDERFHRRLAALAGNEVLEAIVGRLWQDMVTPIFLRLAQRGNAQRKIDATLADHDAIVAAVEARDPPAARQAAHDHIRHTEAWFLTESENDALANPPPSSH